MVRRAGSANARSAALGGNARVAALGGNARLATLGGSGRGSWRMVSLAGGRGGAGA